MRLVINLILIALVALLVWVLIGSIAEPIAFKAEKEKRENAVIDRLIKVRQAQELYRGITGEFAHSFDTLNDVLKNGKIMNISVFGDPDDPDNLEKIRYDTTFESALVSLEEMEINLDSLRYVPYSSGKEFDIWADTLTYQKTLVPVVEVGTIRKTYMGKYGDPKYARYDNSYKPGSTIKFGDRLAPNTSGNWER